MSSICDNGSSDGRVAGGYVFDNASEQAAARFGALEAIFDAASQDLIAQLGIRSGWSCLEVGAGSGSVAAWLSERVGPNGDVLATDIDTRHLDRLRLGNVVVRRHDISRDPLPEAHFDLVHMRLVLIHLSDRMHVLQRLISALKPGGWLLVEEFDSRSLRSDPDANPAEQEFATLEAMHHVMSRRGAELRCGRLLDGWLRHLGLLDVRSEGRMFMWRGGSPGADLMRANICQLSAEILASGQVTEKQLQHDLGRLGNDGVAFPSPILWASRGRRPA